MYFMSCGKIFSALLLLPLLSACASNMLSSRSEGVGTKISALQTVEEKVVSRAQGRWDALLARDYEKAYGFITPSMRATLPLDVFRGRIAGASWIDVKVAKAVCEPEVCDVSVKMEYYVLPNLKDTQVINEKWIIDAGNWWFVYRG